MDVTTHGFFRCVKCLLTTISIFTYNNILVQQVTVWKRIARRCDESSGERVKQTGKPRHAGTFLSSSCGGFRVNPAPYALEQAGGNHLLLSVCSSRRCPTTTPSCRDMSLATRPSIVNNSACLAADN